MSSLPTLVIIPGSFSAVKNYDVLVASLAGHGVTSVVVVDLPSTKRRPDATPATLTDDANEVVRVAEPLLDAGKSIVFLTHSYGGVPGNESLQRLSAKARAAQGKAGGIETHIYLSSIALPVGVSNLAVSGGVLPDFVTREDDYMTLDPAGHAPFTFSDLPLEEALKHAREMSNVHSTPSFLDNTTYAGYNDVNVHYILCEEDKIIPAEAQSAMIDMIKGSSGRDVAVHKVNSGHCPNITRTDETAVMIKGILESL